jgi:hypothetical protein
MTDVLERLRDANPVAEEPAPPFDAVWPLLERAPTPRRWGRARGGWLALGSLIAAAAAFAVFAGGAPASSIAARVYAATASNGFVVHYTALEEPNLLVEAWSTDQTWNSDGRVHFLAYIRTQGRPLGTPWAEQVYTPHGQWAWSRGLNMIEHEVFHGSFRGGEDNCQRLTVLCIESSPDPLTSLRALYRAGRLRDAGTITLNGQSLDVLDADPKPPQPKWQVLVDPHTYLPVLLRQDGTGGPVTTRISDYTRLPRTPQTLRLLDMSPHPGARQCTVNVYNKPVLPRPDCSTAHSGG